MLLLQRTLNFAILYKARVFAFYILHLHFACVFACFCFCLCFCSKIQNEDPLKGYGKWVPQD